MRDEVGLMRAQFVALATAEEGALRLQARIVVAIWSVHRSV
jgi:hypothetical protein